MNGKAAPLRLASATLDRTREGVRRPAYDRARLSPGIVHLGLGAFARAHLLTYTEEAMEKAAAAGAPPDWGTIGVSLRSPDQRDRLAPQDGLYTLVERSADGPRARIVGALTKLLVAPENPAAVVAALARPTTRIVSLTVTEKGYCHDPATGRLRLDHPDIVADLADPSRPVSAVGYLVAGLAARRAAGVAPFTVLCCDNLVGNGALLAGLVDTLARRSDPSLADWIATNGAFPSTMVDRIVPAATPADLDEAAELTGLADAAALAHEPFRQWVIEDRFAGGARPDWSAAGAQIVADVAPYERMKLRMLNAAHSALAWLGYLAGHETIADAMADLDFAAYCRALWASEIIPTLTDLPRAELEAYAETLASRFANKAIRHRTWQIAMDGSQKLPVRILPTIAARREKALASPLLSLAVAAWIRYVGAVDETGAPIDVRDPLASTLKRTHDDAGSDPAARVRAVLALANIFPPALAGDPDFCADIEATYQRLVETGAKAAVASAVRG